MNAKNTSGEPTALPHNTAAQPQGQPLEVVVIGALWHAQFPALCLKCGQQPSGTLPIYKLFRRMEGEGRSLYAVGKVDAPVCAQCFQTQAREQKSIAPSDRQRLLQQWFLEVLPFFVPFGAALWFLTKVIPLFVTTLAHHKPLWQVLVMAGFALSSACWRWRSIA